MPLPVCRAIIGQAMGEAMAKIPPDDRGAACAVLLREALEGLALLYGAEQAAELALAAVDQLPGRGEAG
jgi:hypothetical protein